MGCNLIKYILKLKVSEREVAYIYRYEIKNKANRQDTDLKQHEKGIVDAIKSVFIENLKSVKVFSNYYEFRLKNSTSSRTELQKIGKKIIENSIFLNSKKRMYNKSSQLFRRKKISYYGFLEDISYDNEFYLLKFDAVEKEDSDQILRDIEDNQVSKVDSIRTLDTFSVTVKVGEKDSLAKEIRKLKEGETEEITNQWYLLKGEHVEDGNSFFFLDYRERQDITLSYITTSIAKLSKNKKVLLTRFFNIEHIPYSEVASFEKYNDDFFISVYNVGQGLCSAVCNEQSQPLLYFDFGGGESKNAITYPKDIKFCFSQKPKIVLSHIHRDHWISTHYCKEALETEWIIPDQLAGAQFIQLCIDITKKGTLTVLKSNKKSIKTPYGYLFLATGKNTHAHNDGIGFLVETRNEKRYLMPGDNRYQYIPSQFLNNLNGIVASHHGGEYFENAAGKSAIPTHASKGEIIYSYGKHAKFKKNNSHGHPSYVADYKLKNWATDLHTHLGHCYLERPKMFNTCGCGCNL